MPETQSLSSLIASRICHDLISPIGALGNGLELLKDMQTEPSDEMDLIVDCAAAASSTLSFLRFAFGSAGIDDKVSAEEAQAVAVPYLRQKRITLDWPSQPEESSRLEAKARLLLLMCAIDALPRGGHVSGHESSGVAWAAQGTNIRSDDVLQRIAETQSVAAKTPAGIHYSVLWETARRQGGEPFVKPESDGVLILGIR